MWLHKTSRLARYLFQVTLAGDSTGLTLLCPFEKLLISRTMRITCLIARDSRMNFAGFMNEFILESNEILKFGDLNPFNVHRVTFSQITD